MPMSTCRRPGRRSRLGRHLPALLAEPGPRARGRHARLGRPGQGARPARARRGRGRARPVPRPVPRCALALFAARHDEGLDLRDPDVVAGVLDGAGVPGDKVARRGRDRRRRSQEIRRAHEQAVTEWAVFGVPTFIVEDRAVFVRLMSRPQGDAASGPAHHRGRASSCSTRSPTSTSSSTRRCRADRSAARRRQERASSLSSARPRSRSSRVADDGGDEVGRTGVGQPLDRRRHGLLVARRRRRRPALCGALLVQHGLVRGQVRVDGELRRRSAPWRRRRRP